MTTRSIRITSSTTQKILLFLPATVGTALVLVSVSTYGAGLWPDAVKYIAVARNLISGDGYYYFYARPQPYVMWPPLFPTLLAGLGIFGKTDPLVLAPLVNAVLFGLNIYLSGLLAIKCLKPSPLLPILSTLLVLFSQALFGVSILGASEPLYICLTLATFVCAVYYISTGSPVWLILLAVLTAMAALTRYIGITLIPLGVLIIIFRRKGAVRPAFPHLSAFLVISALPLSLWFIRNYIVSGTLAGARPSSIFTLSQNLKFTVNVVLSWYIPSSVLEQPLVPVIAGLVIIVLLAVRTIKVRRQTVQVPPVVISVFLVYVIFYVTFLVISSTITATDAIDNRLLSPVFVPIALTLLYLTGMLLEPLKSLLPQKSVEGLLVLLVFLMLISPIKVFVPSVHEYLAQGVPGYNDKAWKESETIQSLYAHGIASGDVVYTNQPDALYLLAGINARWSPMNHAYNSPDVLQRIDDLRGHWPPVGKAYLVWFNRNWDFLFTPQELQTSARLEAIAQLDDGVIYAVTKSTP